METDDSSPQPDPQTQVVTHVMYDVDKLPYINNTWWCGTVLLLWGETGHCGGDRAESNVCIAVSVEHVWLGLATLC